MSRDSLSPDVSVSGVPLTDPNSPPSDTPESEEEAAPKGGALEALFAEAIELQDERKKASDKDELGAMIAENYEDGDPNETLSDDDEGLALPDLPDNDIDEALATSTGVDPAIVERLEAELEMLKQQKKILHQQMAQRDGRYESAENRINQLEQQLVMATRQNQGVARDFENFRTRTERERNQQKMLAAEQLLKGFLTVYDNLARALEYAENKEGPLGQGVAMTLDQFLATLERSGAQAVPCEIGSPFDPSYHEAMQQTYSDEIPEGALISVLQSGFMLGDRLLRAAMVNVSQGPDPANKPVAKKKKASSKKKTKASKKTRVAKSKKNPGTTEDKKPKAKKPKAKGSKKKS